MGTHETYIIAGSYDRFLFGFAGPTPSDHTSTALKRSFTYPAHKGPVRCLTTGGQYLASGGADDLLHLYDLHTQADLGFLMNPGEGAVSAVAFHVHQQHVPTHLLSGAADGSIAVWQAGGEWICLKSLRGHKKEVSSVCVHPSGRLALSTSRDASLRLWNLVRGKCAAATPLSGSAEQVAFAPGGATYGLVLGSEVVLYETGRDEPQLRAQHGRRALCMAYVDDSLFMSGSEDGSFRLWDARTGSEPVAEVSGAHSSRIRGIAVCAEAAGANGTGSHVTVTASSDGTVKTWDMRAALAGRKAASLAAAETGARLTCLATMNRGTAAAAAVGRPAATSKVAAKAGRPVAVAAAPPNADAGKRKEAAVRRKEAKAKAQAATPASDIKVQPARQVEGSAATPSNRAERTPEDSKVGEEPRPAAGVEGIARDGVVEFPDSADKRTAKRKRGFQTSKSNGRNRALLGPKRPSVKAAAKTKRTHRKE